METSCLETLPPEACIHILEALHTRDLVAALQASPTLRKAANGVLVSNVLAHEDLPGSTVSELIEHVAKWESYRKDLLTCYQSLIPGFGKLQEPKERNEAFKSFLHQMIVQFTKRVAGAHSCKHLCIGSGLHHFEFFCDLTVNMYPQGDQWIERVQGDGTEFHYTWKPTQVYRDQFGFFEYQEFYPRNDPWNPQKHLKVNHYQNYSNEVFVPQYARSQPVNVTAAIHTRSELYHLYNGILRAAVQQENPNLVHALVINDYLPDIQFRF